jgi:hypothetical protein
MMMSKAVNFLTVMCTTQKVKLTSKGKHRHEIVV